MHTLPRALVSSTSNLAQALSPIDKLSSNTKFRHAHLLARLARQIVAALFRLNGRQQHHSRPEAKGCKSLGGIAVVTAAEISHKHGTGILLQRALAGQPDFVHIRSVNLYGEPSAGKLRIYIPHGSDANQVLPSLLKGSTVSTTICIPWHSQDIRNALALQELTGAKMCLWIMDHNLGTGDSQITNEEFAKVVEASSLCLAISEPMARLYTELFGRPFHFVPPVVDATFAQLTPLPVPVSGECRGVMIGNIWSEKWLDLLLDVLTKAQLPLTIYGTATPPHIDASRLSSIGERKGFVPEAELVADLRKRPYAIVPCGPLDERDDLAHVGFLSLPSRIPYMAAVANLPLIVLGSPSSAAASFVVDNNIGVVVNYEAEALREAVADISRPERQTQFRESAARMARKMCTVDMGSWLLASLDLGKPAGDFRSWND